LKGGDIFAPLITFESLFYTKTLKVSTFFVHFEKKERTEKKNQGELG
jgi:hypothetical protein